MTRLQSKTLAETDDVRTFPKGRVEVVRLDESTVARGIYEPGWRWSKDMQPSVGTPSCQLHHLGFAISGRLRVMTDDGQTMDIGPGMAYETPPGHDAWVLGDEPYVVIDWTSARAFAAPRERGDGVIVTVLLTDIVDSTATLLRLGDEEWREILPRLNARLREDLNDYRGREIKTTGDGLLAIFDNPVRAVRCAAAMSRSARSMDLPIRVGVHTGEVELTTNDVRGLAVHTAARVMSLGGPDDIMVSSTTRDLIEGSGLVLEDTGEHELKGLPGVRRIFRLRPSTTPG